MKNRQIHSKLIFLFIALLLAPVLFAQTMNRAQMGNYILTNVYQNPNHAVTGQTLQNVLLNQNYSYNNLKSDTDFVSMFDTGYTYFRGMAVISGIDTIYRCAVSIHHGVWKSSDFRFIGLLGGGGGSGLSGAGNPPYLPVFISGTSVGSSTIIDGIYVGKSATHITNPNGMELDSNGAQSGIFFNPYPTSNLMNYRVGQLGGDSAMLLNVNTLSGGYFALRCLPNAVIGGVYSLIQSKCQLSNVVDTLPHYSGTMAITSYHLDIQRAVTYRIPASDFDGQTVVELTGAAGSIAQLPNPSSVPAGVPLIIKILVSPGRATSLTVSPFGVETIDGWVNSIICNANQPQTPQAGVKVMTTDNINWITIP